MLALHEGLNVTSASHLQSAVDTLTRTVTELASRLRESPPTPTPAPVPQPAVSPASPEPRVGSPERYDGEPETCSAFITNCTLLFALQPRTFSSEAAKVAYTINHLTGRARLWGTAEWDRQSPACSSFLTFTSELRKVFGQDPDRAGVAAGLLSLHQGRRSVADYSIDFRTQASRGGWNSSAQIDAFVHGLADYIKDGLVPHELPSSLDDIIALATRIDLRIRARRGAKNQASTHPPTPRQQPKTPPLLSSSTMAGDSEPMQLGRTSLTSAERRRRVSSQLCLYCGGQGHFVKDCPVKERAHS